MIVVPGNLHVDHACLPHRLSRDDWSRRIGEAWQQTTVVWQQSVEGIPETSLLLIAAKEALPPRHGPTR